MNSALITVTEDEKVEPASSKSLRKLDRENDQQGLRAFVWEISAMV